MTAVILVVCALLGIVGGVVKGGRNGKGMILLSLGLLATVALYVGGVL